MRRVFSFPLGDAKGEEGVRSELKSRKTKEISNSPSSSSTEQTEVDFEDGLEKSHVGSLVETAGDENDDEGPQRSADEEERRESSEEVMNVHLVLPQVDKKDLR